MLLEPLPLAQFAQDTLGAVTVAREVTVKVRTDLAWLLGVLLVTGLFVIVHTGIDLVSAMLERARARFW